MQIIITNPNHMLCHRTYEVVEVEEFHYIIKLSYNNALVRIFKTDAEEIQEKKREVTNGKPGEKGCTKNSTRKVETRI